MEENQKGLAIAFATFSPFKSGLSRWIQKPVYAGAPKHEGTIRGLAFLHSAYWLTVRRQHLARAGMPKEHNLKHGGLLFVSAFNGNSSDYVRGFTEKLANEMNALWQQCEQWADAKNLDQLNRFIARHRRDANVFFNAYGDNDAKRVRTALLLRQRLEGMAAEHAGGKSDAGALVNQVADLATFLYGGEQLTQAQQALEKHDIQGNILLGYRYPKVVHLFATITDDNLEAWREFLCDLAVTPATRGERPPSTVNIGLSYAGLVKLIGDRAGRIKAAFPAFAEGMSRRAKILRDPIDEAGAERKAGSEHRRRWDQRHLWIAVHSKDDDALAERVRRVKDAAHKGGLSFEHELVGSAIAKEGHWYEHFGFRDDISNPFVAGSERDRRHLPGNGKRDQAGNWVPLAPGEFVLGYPNEAGQVHPHSDLLPWFKNGTFAVFRQLRQDVRAFRTYLQKEAENQVVRPEFLAAKMLGRQPDGKPLGNAGDSLNDFDYENDAGAQCPLGAHIRRSNHRLRAPELGGRHRLIRRGIPYGPPVEDHAPVDDRDRGLLFVGLNANIEDQFEFIQAKWLNERTAKNISTDRDLLVGMAPGRNLVIEGPRPILLLDVPDFVTFLGGQYYFMPGLSALHRIARQPTHPSVVASVTPIQRGTR